MFIIRMKQEVQPSIYLTLQIGVQVVTFILEAISRTSHVLDEITPEYSELHGQVCCIGKQSICCQPPCWDIQQWPIMLCQQRTRFGRLES